MDSGPRQRYFGFAVERGSRPRGHKYFANAGQVVIRDALAAAVAALKRIKKRFPHLARGRRGLPVGSPLEPNLERPFPGEFAGADETLFAVLGVGIGPL